MKNTLLKNPQIISNMITATITLFSLPRANRLHKTWPTIHGCDQTTPVFDRTLSVGWPLFHVLSVQTLSGKCFHFMPNEISNDREKIRLTVLKRLNVLKHFNMYLYLLRSCSLGYITRRIKEEKYNSKKTRKNVWTFYLSGVPSWGLISGSWPRAWSFSTIFW